jgi:hypothetical protein
VIAYCRVANAAHRRREAACNVDETGARIVAMKIFTRAGLAAASMMVARNEKRHADPSSTGRRGMQTRSGISRSRIRAAPIRPNPNFKRPSQALPGMACEKKILTLESASPVVARMRRAQKNSHARDSGNAPAQINMLQKCLIDAGFCDDAGFIQA